MKSELIDELKSLLQGSDTRLRKHWAERIVSENVPVESLLGLLHGHEKTAQRFTWLIGDLLDLDRSVVRDSVPLLFSLRNQMPFPGMQRTVAKCLWFLGVPVELEADAIPQLLEWMEKDDEEIGVKHYAAKSLFDLAVDGRIAVKQLERILENESSHPNSAHAGRMEKMLHKVSKLSKD